MHTRHCYPSVLQFFSDYTCQRTACRFKPWFNKGHTETAAQNSLVSVLVLEACRWTPHDCERSYQTKTKWVSVHPLFISCSRFITVDVDRDQIYGLYRETSLSQHSPPRHPVLQHPLRTSQFPVHRSFYAPFQQNKNLRITNRNLGEWAIALHGMYESRSGIWQPPKSGQVMRWYCLFVATNLRTLFIKIHFSSCWDMIPNYSCMYVFQHYHFAWFLSKIFI